MPRQANEMLVYLQMFVEKVSAWFDENGCRSSLTSVKTTSGPASAQSVISRDHQDSRVSLYEENMSVTDFFIRKSQSDSRLSFQNTEPDICLDSVSYSLNLVAYEEQALGSGGTAAEQGQVCKSPPAFYSATPW